MSSILCHLKEISVSFHSRKIFNKINLKIPQNARIGIVGKNAFGKSTLLKALLNNQDIEKKGYWKSIEPARIGYLDQHYANLDDTKSVVENMYEAQTDMDRVTIREHLNDFLFRKNNEINKICSFLSGGEKARLSLAILAAKMPELIILDEVTNNIDIMTKNHLIQVLESYHGAMIIVSHDIDFLSHLSIDKKIFITDGVCKETI